MTHDSTEHGNSKSTLMHLLLILSLALSIVALASSIRASNKASEALDRINEQINTTTTNPPGPNDLMRGTGQPPTEPPTQE